jgi:hypothetical protein
MQTDVPTFTLRMKEDNQASINWSKNPVFHSKSKHILVKYHYIRELWDAGKITLDWTPTAEMEADMHTKPLSRVLLERHCRGAGLKYDSS